jgi:hypothetical protein
MMSSKTSCIPSLECIGTFVWKEQWYTFTSRVSLQADLHMICEDQNFVANVVVTNSTWEMVTTSVISWPTCATTEFSINAKIRKYRRFHDRHHFIPMAMEVHNAFRHDMDHFIKECACLFHNRWSGGHYPCLFVFNFFMQHVSIVL